MTDQKIEDAVSPSLSTVGLKLPDNDGQILSINGRMLQTPIPFKRGEAISLKSYCAMRAGAILQITYVVF